MLVRFPRLAGMVPDRWFSLRDLQQWKHEAKTMQRVGGKDGVRFISIS